MKKIEKGEWIGIFVKALYNGKEFERKIIDKTKNTISIKTKNGVKKILKNNSKIMIDGKTLNGDNLKKRPEERIKLK